MDVREGKRAKRVLAIHDEAASDRSRLVALRVAILTLRLMENWRRPFKDYDSAMIMIAIAAIVGERLTRMPLEPEYLDLSQPIPPDRLTKCNITSIAAATGLNRETARRKVKKLVAAGLLDRAADGSIVFSAGFTQRGEPGAIVRTQLETLTRITNELLREDVLTWSEVGL